MRQNDSTTKKHLCIRITTCTLLTFLTKYGDQIMTKAKTISLIIIGILLIINGLLNIIDDSRVLAFDITSILAGIGFIILSIQNKSNCKL